MSYVITPKGTNEKPLIVGRDGAFSVNEFQGCRVVGFTSDLQSVIPEVTWEEYVAQPTRDDLTGMYLIATVTYANLVSSVRNLG